MSKKTKFLLPLSILIVLLYVILAALPLQKELRFVPVWTVATEDKQSESQDEKNQDKKDSLIPFKLGQTAGYFTHDGEVTHKITFPYKISISKNSYAVYGTAAEQTAFFSPDGSKISEIELAGFPYFTENRNYNFYPGGSSFAVLSDDGKAAWKYEGFSPITAFASSGNGCAAGFASGKVVAFSPDGDVMQQYKPGGSNYEVIFGIALSDSAEYIATLSGLESQRFVISRRSSSSTSTQPAIVFYKTLKNELKRQVVIKFSKNEERVFFDSGDGLGIVSLTDFSNTMIPLKGEILSIAESKCGKQVFILSKSGRTYTVSAIQSFDVLAGSFSFEADCAFIASDEDSLFIGKDSEISRIDIKLQ